ncbi:MAG: CHRD domain-containing protein [Actinomycetota bacterium]
MRSKAVALILTSVALVSLFTAATSAKNKQGRFSASLTGYQEVPSISTPATGEARLRLVRTGAGPTIPYRLEYRDIQNAVAAHIHLGQAGVNGGVSAFLCGGGDTPACPPTGGTVTGTIEASDVIGPSAQGIDPGEIAELVKAMQAGVTYVNVHTSDGNDDPSDPTGPGDLPTGEIRGHVG